MVARKTRVITIALGETADPDIEALAERTGGKSYFVDDNSGPGDFNDAFSGSTTYQPGDTLGNTVIVVHQGWKSMSCSLCQELCQLSDPASDWLHRNEQPIRSQVSKLTQLLT